MLLWVETNCIWFIKNQICFWELKKNWFVNERKTKSIFTNQNLLLKKKYHICFWKFRKNGFGFIKDQIFFCDKKNCVYKKIQSFFVCLKNMKMIFLFYFFFRREFHSWIKFMLHVLNKTNTVNTIMHDLFLYFKIRICQKTSDLYLIKIQISLYFFLKKNFRSTSKEDADQFLIWGKFRSTSKEDVDPFLF